MDPDDRQGRRVGSVGKRRVGRAPCLAVLAYLFATTIVCPLTTRLVAQGDTTSFYKGLDLEASGKYRDAVPMFRASLHSAASVNALLGLERVYAELGWTDSLVAPLDTLIAADPREETYRTVQLRTLQSIGRTADLRRAFDRWVHDMPNSSAPYREYARLLLDKNQTAAADSILALAGTSLGTTRDLQLEIAQARAAEGRWLESAQAWREALIAGDYLAQAAAYALAPTPPSTRPTIEQVFLAPPIEVGPRRALAELQATWGSPADGWAALRDLPPDSSAADAWAEFATRAEAEEQWTVAREALESVLRWRRTPETAIRAATAALNAGDAAAALRLAPISDAKGDSALIARSYLPLQARALAALGRPADAERLVAAFDRFLAPGQRDALARTVAWGWVRTGDMVRARAALAAAGASGDSSDAAGWLALYDGNLKTARALLRGGTETSPELALALGLIARLKVDTAPAIGRAFLTLARGDTAAAAAKFTSAANGTPTVRSLLLATAAQLDLAQHRDADALALWRQVLADDPTSPEAPEAELDWARTLRRAGNTADAQRHLEHLILTYPESALLPQARRELELVKSAIPPGR